MLASPAHDAAEPVAHTAHASSPSGLFILLPDRPTPQVPGIALADHPQFALPYPPPSTHPIPRPFACHVRPLHPPFLAPPRPLTLVSCCALCWILAPISCSVLVSSAAFLRSSSPAFCTMPAPRFHIAPIRSVT